MHILHLYFVGQREEKGIFQITNEDYKGEEKESKKNKETNTFFDKNERPQNGTLWNTPYLAIDILECDGIPEYSGVVLGEGRIPYTDIDWEETPLFQ